MVAAIADQPAIGNERRAWLQRAHDLTRAGAHKHVGAGEAMGELEVSSVILDGKGEAPDELSATAYDAVHRSEHEGAAEVVEQALRAARLNAIRTHTHDVYMGGEEADDGRSDGVRVTRSDGSLEAGIGFDVVQRCAHVWAAGLLFVDPF